MRRISICFSGSEPVRLLWTDQMINAQKSEKEQYLTCSEESSEDSGVEAQQLLPVDDS
jgi:hypothetical protein